MMMYIAQNIFQMTVRGVGDRLLNAGKIVRLATLYMTQIDVHFQTGIPHFFDEGFGLLCCFDEHPWLRFDDKCCFGTEC